MYLLVNIQTKENKTDDMGGNYWSPAIICSSVLLVLENYMGHKLSIMAKKWKKYIP